jgi:hypothetical protein
LNLYGRPTHRESRSPEALSNKESEAADLKVIFHGSGDAGYLMVKNLLATLSLLNIYFHDSQSVFQDSLIALIDQRQFIEQVVGGLLIERAA